MAKDLNLDYICELETKWKNYLRKYDPWSPQKRIIEADVRDTIDDMKNNTSVGRMLYFFFDALKKGDLKMYSKNFKK